MKLSYIPDEIAPDEHFEYVDFMDIKKRMYAVSTYGRVINIKSGKELKQSDKDGYRYVELACVKRKQRNVYVHRLVATAFLPKTVDEFGNERNLINHKDLNAWNNNVNNLEWCTQKENVIHAFQNNASSHIDESGDEHEFLYVTIIKKHGVWKNQAGEGNNNAKLTNEQVHYICKELEKKTLTADILQALGIERNPNNIALISSIRQGKRWKSISSLYNITKTR